MILCFIIAMSSPLRKEVNEAGTINADPLPGFNRRTYTRPVIDTRLRECHLVSSLRSAGTTASR